MYRRESKFFEIQDDDGYDGKILIKFTIDENMRFQSPIEILKAPTKNCQLCIIGGIEKFLQFRLDKKAPTIFKQIIRLILNYVVKRIVLIDIHQRESQYFIDLFAPFGEVLTRTPYKSTNNSLMEIIMFRLEPNLQIRKY